MQKLVSKDNAQFEKARKKAILEAQESSKEAISKAKNSSAEELSKAKKISKEELLKAQIATGTQSDSSAEIQRAQSAQPAQSRTNQRSRQQPVQPQQPQNNYQGQQYAQPVHYPAPPEPTKWQIFKGMFKQGPREELETPRIVYEGLIVLAIIVHVLDGVKFNFAREYYAARLVLYLILALAIHLTLNRGWQLKDSVWAITKLCLVTLFLIPMSAEILEWLNAPDMLVEKAAALAWAVPIWLIYILYRRNTRMPLGTGWTRVRNLLLTPSGWATIWFFILGVAAFFMLFTTLGDTINGGENSLLIDAGAPIAGGIGGGSGSGGLIPSAGSGGFDPTDAVAGIGGFLGKSLDMFTVSVNKLYKGISGQYETMKNESLGQYYTGQVEQNKELTGVFITDFHVTGKQYDSVPVVAYGYIKARSFVEGINITPSCYAQSATNKSAIYQGRVDPPELTNLYIEDQRGVICTFENYGFVGGALPAGRYQIFLVLDFPFETWAYKQYYFLDRNYLVYLKTTGINPNTKLQIPLKTKTTYTNGPVMIGMDDAIEMPFGISNENDNYLPIGMTLDDKPQSFGAKGQVMQVYEYSLRMPKEFLIKQKAGGSGLACTVDAATVDDDPKVTGYNIYKFDIAAMSSNIALAGAYMTLNCNVEIPAEQVVNLIPGANAPAIVTVVGTAKYDYRLSKQIPVTVEKTPGT